MSIERILQSLFKLIDVHNELHEISKRKTEALKSSATTDLQNILIEEQRFIQQLEQAEQKREKFVNEWFSKHHASKERTITNLLNLLTDTKDKERLEKAAIDLTKAIAQLQDSEQLNAALLQQSMHFIQTSLNMFQPNLQSMNYERQQTKSNKQPYSDRSMFDSRA